MIGKGQPRRGTNHMPESSEIALAKSWVTSVRQLGMQVRLEGNRVRLLGAARGLPAHLRATWSTHRKAIKQALRNEAATTPAPHVQSKAERVPEAAPELYAYGHRVTEADVEAAMRNEGDEVLAAYRAGRIPRWDAYERAQCRMRQLLEFDR